MYQDDPGKRIVDLEHQLAEQNRDIARPPVGPDRSRPGSASNSVPDQRRFVATRIPNTRQNMSAFGLVMALFLLCAVSVMTPVRAVHIITYIRPVLFVGIFVLGFLIYSRLMRKKVVISVTVGGLSIDQRPGDVFSFRDAELGQWRSGRRGSAGRALVLVAGPQRFVLGETGSSIASGVPTDGPQVDILDLEAWIKPQTLDELLAVVGHRRALEVRGPAPAQPPAQTTDAPQGTRRPLNWWVLITGVLILLFLVGAGLHSLSDYWYPAYQYEMGTPATATIDHCDESRTKFHMITCTATWTVNGQTQSGLIDNGLSGGNRKFVAGSSLAVHVKDGTAYTAHTVESSIFLVGFFGLFLIGLCALLIRGVWSIRRAR